MGPRKRPRVNISTSVKRKRKSPEKCHGLQENPDTKCVLRESEYRVESYLSLLPNEVLLHIYKYLSPVDLSSLSKLDNQRLTDLTYTVKEANISSCRKDSLLLVTAFFTRNMVKYIQKLNFNYYFFIKPYDLAHIICRCKKLTSLSVVQCGLTYNNIINILQSCTKLEELAWNVGEVVQLLNISCPVMKRVYLFCDIKEVSLNSVYYTIRNFPQVENVWINFASDSISALPFIGLWLRSSCVSCPILRRKFTLITNSFQCVSIASDLVFLSEIISREIRENEKNGETFTAIARKVLEERREGKKRGETVRSKMNNCPPYLQIRSINEDISLLSSGPFNAYTTVAIILTPEIIDVSESLVKCLQEISGAKLKHLSLQSDAEYYTTEPPRPVSNEGVTAACGILEKTVLTSKNITILNLTTIHFKESSPIKAITQLPYLKVLNIPSCAFDSSYSKLSHYQNCELSDVVENCPKVEEFVLNCCYHDLRQLSEDAVVCIKNWRDLKHLSIYSMTFRTCSFLQKVADCCVRLQSLSIISVAPHYFCLFTNDVIYLLKKAKNLTFLRINEEKFYPMFERLWSAIGEAVNLEGICIITRSKGPVDTQTVIKGIKQLKYLHLFHFFAPRASENLYNEAKKSMQEHGVKNIKVEKFCNINSFSVNSGMQYFHQQPHFCCQHLHLKDIDIF